MSRERSGRRPISKRDKSARGQADVGYCKPPKEHQFKSGRSGNPKGRPKGAKNEATILRDIFNRRIEIREGGRARKISLLEAMLLKFVEDALKGNPKTATFLLNRYRLVEGVAAETNEFDQDDRQVLDAFVRPKNRDIPLDFSCKGSMCGGDGQTD